LRHLTDAQAALLARISAATTNRRLAVERSKLPSLDRSHTKPGILLKSQIPIRTWADCDDAINALPAIWWIGQYPSSPLQPSHLGTLGTAGTLGTVGIVLLALSVGGFRRRDLKTS